eukprot:scaffold81097_cov40-Prasinocladus_malaysianus.AAC.1
MPGKPTFHCMQVSHFETRGRKGDISEPNMSVLCIPTLQRRRLRQLSWLAPRTPARLWLLMLGLSDRSNEVRLGMRSRASFRCDPSPRVKPEMPFAKSVRPARSALRDLKGSRSLKSVGNFTGRSQVALMAVEDRYTNEARNGETGALLCGIKYYMHTRCMALPSSVQNLFKQSLQAPHVAH